VKPWEAKIVVYDYVIETFWAYRLEVKRPDLVIESNLLYDTDAEALRAARRTLKRLGLVERKERRQV
jgi:hypothetical protein